MHLIPLLLALAPAPQGPAPAPPEARPIISMTLEAARARSLNNFYEESDHWALRGIVLCSYGELWHPEGTASIVDALEGKQPELQAFALEALLATDPEHLPRVMDAELIDVLLTRGAKLKHEDLAKAVGKVLARGLPGVEAADTGAYKSWWRKAEKTWQPPAWDLVATSDELPEGGSSAGSFLRRAFDLNTAGMEVAIVIDTTGSMQTTIDASAAALSDITELLEGIAPKLRMGLVEYKDEEFPGGAQTVQKLTPKVDKVRSRLGRLVAEGGGDIPEAVFGGLRLALDEKLGWERAANKLVVIIGDAPAHPHDQAQVEELAREANRSPFGADASEIIEVSGDDDRSRSKRGVRPFIVSTIGVGGPGVPTQTKDSLQAIATAGGGAYAEVLLEAPADTEPPSTRIVKHILTLAFGSRWASQMDRFLDIYLKYRDAGAFE